MFSDIVLIGQGTYGKVYKSKNTKTGEVVAIKKVQMSSLKEGIPCTTLREISILKQLKHRNIVDLKEVKSDENQIIMVFEYCKYDLKRYMKSKNMQLSHLEIISFSCQLLKSINYIHSKSIIHRDIKPQNILITEFKCFKLCDFGLSRIMNIPDASLSLEVVTQWYRAPEILMKSENYGLESDIWSAGCVIAEMITGVPLFPFNNDEQQLFEMFHMFGTPTEEYWPGVRSLKRFPKNISPMIGKGIRPVLGTIPNDLCQLVEDLLQMNPSKRLTAKEALEYPVFKSLSL